MTVASLRAIRLACVITLYVAAGAWGVHATFQDGPDAVDFLFSVLFSLLVVFAAVADSKIVGRQMPSIVPFLMLCSWPVTVPGYLVSTRRWKGIALGVMFPLTLWLVYYFTAMATYYLRLLVWLLAP